MNGRAWKAAVHGVARSWTRLSDFTFTFHFEALEKEMATHSSVLGWRIPGTGGAWWAAVCGVAQSQTRLKRLSSSIAGQLGARSKYLRGELGTSQETCLPWPCLRCYRYRCVSVTSPLKFKGRAPTGLLFWSEQCQSSIVRGICGMGEMIATIFGKYNLPEHVSESMFFWYLKMGKNIYSP